MLQGKALVLAVMMLTAAPIAVTDEGQNFMGDVTDNVSERFVSTNPEREEILPEDNLVDEKLDREKLTSDDKAADERNTKSESDEGKEEPCFTWADLEKKMKDDRKDWDKEGKDRDREDKESKEDKEEREEVDEEESEDDRARGEDESQDESEKSEESEKDEALMAEMEELKEACEEGDEDACLELREIMAELMEENKEDWDREEKDWDKEGKDWNKEGIDEEACLTMEEWEEKLGSDKKSKDERWEYSDWSHEHLRELYIVLEKDCEAGDEESCEQLAILEANKEKFGKEKDRERDWEDEEICIREDENGVVYYDCEKDGEMDEVRAMMVELEVACEDGNETSCEELEEMMASLEEEKEEEKEECGREKEESEDESEEESEDEENSDEE
tara:strand:+ start:307 stop:1476 length:1170 start_codon:yes stop_codon:yes gene_type:complete